MTSRNILILYASQTGYALETAQRIFRESLQRHFQATLKSMDLFDISTLPLQCLVVFVCSVTGQGIEPDTMKGFWRVLLRKDLQKNSLSSLQFAVFGQGDSSYQKFNYPAKKLHKRLEQLGGKAVVERGDGDDQHFLGVDGALDPWLQKFWDKVLVGGIYPLPPGKEIISDTVIPLNTFEVVAVDNHIKSTAVKVMDKFCKVELNLRITPEDHFQDVRKLEFCIRQGTSIGTTAIQESDSNATRYYEAGDVMVIEPENRAEKVQEVLNYFQWSSIADNYYQFTPNALLPGTALPEFLNCPITPRILLEKHLDIFGRPRRYFFHLLSFFALDELHAEKLEEFASTEGQNDLYIYAHKMKRTTFEVLQDFTSVKVPLKYLLDLVPVMRSKSFSISSTSLLDPLKLQLVVAVVNYKTKLQQPRVGVCTDWLKSLKLGDFVRYSITKGTLKLPPVESNVPIICIAAGTGIAPIRSLLLEYCNKLPLVKNCLVFGNRNENADYFFKDDWPTNIDIITAFSRDQPNKIYIQHRILENGPKLWDLIHNKGATIYLCGSSKRMPIDVADALEEVFIKYGHLEPEDAAKYLKRLEKDRRYQEETWS